MLAFVVVCSLAYVVNGNGSIYMEHRKILTKLLADSFYNISIAITLQSLTMYMTTFKELS